MSTAVRLREDELIFANEMRNYVQTLREAYAHSPLDACEDAREALLRTGVTSSDGATKEKIVSWE